MNNDVFVKLPKSFYVRDNVVQIAQDLLGKYLLTDIDGHLTGGIIVETEAYNGRQDRACHAYRKRTPRTEVMYGEGGRAYVYLCYGIHHLFNIVTNTEGLADAVLVRAIEPVIGMETMANRTLGKPFRMTSGPGKLAKALAIHKDHSGTALDSDHVFVASLEGVSERKPTIVADVRIGVDYAGSDALLPWRFFIDDNQWVSYQKTSIQ